MLKYGRFILHSIVSVGGVYDEVQCKGEKRNESRCLLDTELRTEMKDERRGGSPKKTRPHSLQEKIFCQCYDN